jgi:N-acetylglucosaminyldiphosphoundecaprenol N-acetyl-beta-D-mannosaminyltransferase
MVTSEWRIRWQTLATNLTLLPHEASYTDFLNQLTSLNHPTSLAFANANAFNIAANDADFYTNLIGSSLIVRDGIGVSIFLKMLLKQPGLNLNGTDLIPVLVDMFAQYKQAFYGTTPDVVLQAAVFANARGAQDVLVLDGFQSESVYIEHAQKYTPRLIVLGMGMPRQEWVAKNLREVLDYPVLIICGGAILDFMGGKVSRAPEFIRRYGMEWAYRLALEPQRLFKRYIIGNPLFLARGFWMAVQNRRQQKRSPLLALPAPLQPMAVPMSARLAPVYVKHANRAPGFQANRPVTTPDDLFGRTAELARLRSCIIENHGHVLIYGQRGYGKTSLARVFGGIADEAGQNIFYISCARNLEFSNLVALLADEIISSMPTNIELARKHETWRQAVPTIFEIAEAMNNIQGGPVIFILDEYDRIGRDDTRESLIELIKNLSDIGADVKFMLVGVASDAIQILGCHPSIHRCLTCIPLHRLTPDSLEKYLSSKSQSLNLNFSPKVMSDIVHVCAGSSYHAQLVGQLLMDYSKDTSKVPIESEQLMQVFHQIVQNAVVMDPSLAVLTDYYAVGVMQAKKLMLLVDSSLAHDDVIRESMLVKGKAARALCEYLLSQNALEVSAITPDGKVRDFRFSNGFTPQILRMVDLIAQTKNGSLS